VIDRQDLFSIFYVKGPANNLSICLTINIAANSPESLKNMIFANSE
jgi:hypothetical protein